MRIGFGNYPNGFSSGLMVRGIQIDQRNPGKVFWVGNPSTLQLGEKLASDNNAGTNRGTFLEPFSTIAFALSQCLSGRGDVIMVKPGHTLTLTNATALILNVADVAIIGLGSGSSRPTITFSTNATANIPVTVANLLITNFLFKANVADVVSVFTATSTNTPTDLWIDNCEFKDVASNKNFISIVTGNATANSMDGLKFTGNRISSLGATAATTAIKLSSATDRVTISDNFGNWAVLNDTAAMLAAGANNVTNFEFARNKLQRPNTSSTGGSFISTSATAWTGHAYDNYMYQLDNTAGIWIATGTGGAFGFTNNFSPITGAVDKSALVNPAAV